MSGLRMDGASGALLELADALDGARCACEYFGHRGDSCGGCPAESAADCTAAVRRDAARRIRECVGDAAVRACDGATSQKTLDPQSECGNDVADAHTASYGVIAADGEPLEAGQTVWEVDGTGHAFEVVAIRPDTGRAMERTVVTCDTGDGTSEHREYRREYHRKWREEHREHIKVSAAKRRLAKRAEARHA